MISKDFRWFFSREQDWKLLVSIRLAYPQHLSIFKSTSLTFDMFQISFI